MTKKIFIQSISKDRTADNYDRGEDPDTRESVMHETIGKVFDDFETALLYLSGWGFSTRKEDYIAFEEGRIVYSAIENEAELPPSESEMALFKEGKLDLYSVDYEIYMKIITEEDSSQDAISSILNIQKYN